MKYIANIEDFHLDGPFVVTLGKFDGKHKGHQKLLECMLKVKEKYGYQTAVFTFVTPPANLTKGRVHQMITTNEERRFHMESIGIDCLIEYPFTEGVAKMAPEAFIQEILVKRMNAKAIVVGTDCRFGYQRMGDANLLETKKEYYGYELFVIEKEKDQVRDISSTYIKECLKEGNVTKANELLGHPYTICGTVVEGNQLGASVLGFPTVNVIPSEDKYLPLFGVYVSQVYLNKRCYYGITNIGNKPTVSSPSKVGAETHIFDFQGDVYGEQIEVCLLEYIRPEKKFINLEQLKKQIQRDILKSKSFIFEWEKVSAAQV